MSIYSRTLKHVNHKDFRRTHQRHLDEQEVLCKIERQKNLKEKKEIKEIKKLSSPFKSNWREELKIAQNQREEVVENSINKEYDWREQVVFDRKKYFEEGMTSSETFSIALPAIGDVDLSSPPLNSLASHNASIVGGTVTISGDPSPFLTQGILLNFDAREYDTLKFDVSIPPGAVLGFLGPTLSPLLVVLSSGTHILTIPPNLRTQNFEIILDTPDSVTMSVSNFAFQRRTPINVFVSLDSPEATAFIRTDPMMSNLSPKERLQKLKEMLEASDEYVLKMLGFDFPGTGAVPPGEYDPFTQAPAGEAGDTPGVDVTDMSNLISGTQSQPEQPTNTSGLADPFAIMKALNIPFTDAVRAANRANSKNSQSQPEQPTNTSGLADPFAIMKALNIPFTDAVRAANRANSKNSQSQPPKPTQPKSQQPSDTYQDIKKGNIPSEKPISNNPYGTEVGQISQLLPLPPAAPGPSGYQKPGTYDPNKFFNLAPGSLPSPNIPQTGPGLSQTPQDIQIAGSLSGQRIMDTSDPIRPSPRGPYSPIKLDPHMKQYAPSGPSKDPWSPTGLFRTASYKPQGELISERRKLKSPEEVLNKIPGYYDGKPAPLGFPVEPPPKMVNGMHPDLVDGKKVADRFNRLDPQSAQAMPLTGNPHIDKKVLKARKQPK